MRFFKLTVNSITHTTSYMRSTQEDSLSTSKLWHFLGIYDEDFGVSYYVRYIRTGTGTILLSIKGEMSISDRDDKS